MENNLGEETVDRHIVYYSANKKMQTKALKEKLNNDIQTINRLKTETPGKVENKVVSTKPLNINISLTTKKFILRIIIKSIPVSNDEFLVNSSCLFVTR